MRRDGTYFFVDQYNAEFNRCHPADEGRIYRQLLHADG